MRVARGVHKLYTFYKIKNAETMSFSKAKAMFKKNLTIDPKISGHIRGFLITQIKQKKSWYRVKNPPGYDVGHRIRGYHHPKMLKLELIRDNRSRGAKFERGSDAYKKNYLKINGSTTQ